MKRALNLLLFLLSLPPLLCLHAADLVLFQPGKAPAPIVIYQGAPPRTHDAAITLADYLEKITGTRPQLIEGEPKPLPAHAIWIGYQPVLKQLFPKTDFNFQHAEEIIITANADHLVIAGRDRWDPKHMVEKGRLSMKTNMQQEYGTANAVYTFIQEKLNVRWLWPGEEDIIKQSRIAFAPFELRYHPQIRARAGMFTKLSLGDNKEGPDELWDRFQRVQLDSMEINGGHGFGDWWSWYHESHPEYFAAAPDGSRPPVAFNSRNTKLCESNPAVWNQWLENVTKEIAENPTKRVFNVSPNDGYTSGHCTCSNCLAWDNPKGEKMTWTFPHGVKFEGVAQTDRDVRFANTLARMLKKRFPDRELYVQLNAYGFARNPPIDIKPDDNVIISSVANFHLRGNGQGDDHDKAMQQHAEWASKARNIMWRPNLGNPVGLSWGMPDVGMTAAGKDFRFVADNHCLGLYFDLFWFHWSTQGPHYYALAHLAWNPYTDVEALMDDYYARGFGPAAGEVKSYWKLLERTRNEFVATKHNRQRAFDIPEKYTPELLAQAQSYLDAAAKKLANGDEKYRRRLHFFQCGLDYTRLVVDTRRWMQVFEKSKGKDISAKQHVLDNWKLAGVMKKKFPEFAINWQAVFREGGDGKRIMGLHPDHPLSGRTLRELQTPGLE